MSCARVANIVTGVLMSASKGIDRFVKTAEVAVKVLAEYVNPETLICKLENKLPTGRVDELIEKPIVRLLSVDD